MTKRLVVSFLVLAIMAAFAPMTQAQSIRNSREYRRYWTNQTIRDFSPGGLYAQRGWQYNQRLGYGLPYGDDYYRRGGFAQNILVPFAAGAGGYFLGKRQGLNQGRQEGYEVGVRDGHERAQEPPRSNEQRRDQPERDERENECSPERIRNSPYLQNKCGVNPVAPRFLYSNWAGSVITLTNDRLNQQQTMKPGTTLRLPWDPHDVQAYATIEDQFHELKLEVEGSDVAITAPSGS